MMWWQPRPQPAPSAPELELPLPVPPPGWKPDSGPDSEVPEPEEQWVIIIPLLWDPEE